MHDESALHGCTAFGQVLSQSDCERGVAYLRQPRDGVVRSTTGLSKPQMKFRLAADCWSMAETLEHIALVEDLILQNFTNKILRDSPIATRRNSTPWFWLWFPTEAVASTYASRSCRAAALWPRASNVFRIAVKRPSNSCKQRRTCAGMLARVGPSSSRWAHTNGCSSWERKVRGIPSRSSK